MNKLIQKKGTLPKTLTGLIKQTPLLSFFRPPLSLPHFQKLQKPNPNPSQDAAAAPPLTSSFEYYQEKPHLDPVSTPLHTHCHGRSKHVAKLQVVQIATDGTSFDVIRRYQPRMTRP